jgi:hypothetical protein
MLRGTTNVYEFFTLLAGTALALALWELLLYRVLMSTRSCWAAA